MTATTQIAAEYGDEGPAMSELRYDTLLLRREGLTRDVPAGDNEDLRWVANSVTLIYGDQDAVPVDSFLTIGENQRLIELDQGARPQPDARLLHPRPR